MKAFIRCVTVLAALAAFSGVAKAQDFYWNTASVRSNGLGGVYVASSTDVVDALAANPAGLTVLRGGNLDLAVDSVFARGSFSNSANNNAPLSADPGVVPYGAFGMPIGHSKFSFGVGAMPELLANSDWHYMDAPGTAGATYGYQQQKSAIDAVRFAGGLGYAVNSRLSLGVTVGAVYNTNTYDAPYIFQTQPALAGLKTLLDMHTSGVGWNASAGALFQATRKIQVGLAWKSRTEINTSGNASGDAYAQFAALGINAPSTFTYNAKVQNVLPESILANVAWQATPKWLFAFQTDWINWKNSFVELPVTMTNGTNAVINSVVGGNSFSDGIPLHWKDQYGLHVGVERRLLESTVVRFGFAHANSPVPDSTLTPLDGAILTNEISAGLGYTHGSSRIDVSYGFRPENTQQVGQSALLAGEYSNSSVSVGTQSLALGYSYHF
jgi:long-chain fatty acid transport protein